MKLLSLIVSYDSHNNFVQKVHDSLKKHGDVILFTTDIPKFNCNYIVFPKTIGVNLVYEPRKWLVNNSYEDWDYILYTEDDILIPSTSIHNVINFYEKFSYKNLIPGFVRYELFNNEKMWIDLHPAHSIHRNCKNGVNVSKIYDNIKMFEPCNVHSGNWIFRTDHITNMIKFEQFELYHNQYGIKYYTELEDAASLPYLRYTKILPFDLSLVECHHLPNKYVHICEQTNKLIYEKDTFF